MKNRIEICFDNLEKENKKALVGYIVAGDPDLDTTEKIIVEMFDKGADIVEIGVPFSDPIAEKPHVQEAYLRSLGNGTTTDGIFEVVKNVRKTCDKPIIFAMYINTIFRYGTEKFFKLCKEYGVDGVSVPDLPFEERDEIQSFADENEVININLVAPTSRERVNMIAEETKGFLYCLEPPHQVDLEALVANVKCKVCADKNFDTIDFGAEVSESCDGIIVSSQIVDVISKNKGNEVKAVGEFVSNLRKALDK